jgi:hypothetical protein
MTKPRNGHRERKARELRDLLNFLDPPRIKPTPSPAMNLWERPAYRPEQMGSGRSGANNHQHIKSKGF